MHGCVCVCARGVCAICVCTCVCETTLALASLTCELTPTYGLTDEVQSQKPKTRVYMKSGFHLRRVTMQSIRETEGPLSPDSGACVCRCMCVCVCRCSRGVEETMPKRIMVLYSRCYQKEKVELVNLVHVAEATLLECVFLKLRTHRHKNKRFLVFSFFPLRVLKSDSKAQWTISLKLHAERTRQNRNVFATDSVRPE